jgi:hypothetical protein
MIENSMRNRLIPLVKVAFNKSFNFKARIPVKDCDHCSSSTYRSIDYLCTPRNFYYFDITDARSFVRAGVATILPPEIIKLTMFAPFGPTHLFEYLIYRCPYFYEHHCNVSLGKMSNLNAGEISGKEQECVLLCDKTEHPLGYCISKEQLSFESHDVIDSWNYNVSQLLRLENDELVDIFDLSVDPPTPELEKRCSEIIHGATNCRIGFKT